MDLFSAAGISAWRHRLNRSPSFAEAAKTWTGRLLLIETDDAGQGRSAWVVVENGQCIEARPGRTADEAAADYVLAATPSTWSDLVAARITPAGAALTGRLALRKGDLLALIPHAKAAAELLAAAAGDSP